MRQLLLKAVQISVFLFVLFGNIYFDWQLPGQVSGLFALLAAIFSTAIFVAIGDLMAWARGLARRLKPAVREQSLRTAPAPLLDDSSQITASFAVPDFKGDCTAAFLKSKRPSRLKP